MNKKVASFSIEKKKRAAGTHTCCKEVVAGLLFDRPSFLAFFQPVFSISSMCSGVAVAAVAMLECGLSAEETAGAAARIIVIDEFMFVSVVSGLVTGTGGGGEGATWAASSLLAKIFGLCCCFDFEINRSKGSALQVFSPWLTLIICRGAVVGEDLTVVDECTRVEGTDADCTRGAEVLTAEADCTRDEGVFLTEADCARVEGVLTEAGCCARGMDLIGAADADCT